MDSYASQLREYNVDDVQSSDDEEDQHPYSGRFVPAEYIKDDEDDPEDTTHDLPPTSEWVHHAMCNVELRLDDVDKWLYKMSKKEISAVNNHINKKLQRKDDFTECQIVAVWLKDTAKSLVDLVNNQRKPSMEPFSLDEVILLIKSTMWMMAFNVTYSIYYDDNNRSMYPMASKGISKRRYRDLLHSLSACSSDKPRCL